MIHKNAFVYLFMVESSNYFTLIHLLFSVDFLNAKSLK